MYSFRACSRLALQLTVPRLPPVPVRVSCPLGVCLTSSFPSVTAALIDFFSSSRPAGAVAQGPVAEPGGSRAEAAARLCGGSRGFGAAVSRVRKSRSRMSLKTRPHA